MAAHIVKNRSAEMQANLILLESFLRIKQINADVFDWSDRTKGEPENGARLIKAYYQNGSGIVPLLNREGEVAKGGVALNTILDRIRENKPIKADGGIE